MLNLLNLIVAFLGVGLSQLHCFSITLQYCLKHLNLEIADFEFVAIHLAKS